MADFDDLVRQFFDEKSKQAEYSAVSGDTRRHISAIIGDAIDSGRASEDEVAARVVRELPTEGLAEIVTDWLREQVAL